MRLFVIILIVLSIVPSFGTAARQHSRQNTAYYTVTFESTWSASTHPDNFPSNPHFSGLIGATHTSSITFWEEGQVATAGIESMAERGSKDPFRSEIESAMASGSAGAILSGGGIATSPGSVSLDFQISTEFPLVTLVSMLAPSPDWFVGVSRLTLFEDGQWVQHKAVDLFVYDSGTDSGPNYTSPDIDTQPRESITGIRTSPFLTEGAVRPVGTFTFTRTGEVSVEDEFIKVVNPYLLDEAYPNPFNMQATLFLTVSKAQKVHIEVYDILGRHVALLHNGMLDANERRRFVFTCGNRPSGVYMIQVAGEAFTEIQKVLLMK